MRRRPPRSPLLPYTTLCRSLEPMVRAAQRELRGAEVGDPDVVLADAGYWHQRQIEAVVSDGIQVLVSPDSSLRRGPRPDRKSTRLNSSHANISYAVFCLKKK